MKFTEGIKSMTVLLLARHPVDCAFANPGKMITAAQATISIPDARRHTRRQSPPPLRRACAIIVVLLIDLLRCPGSMVKFALARPHGVGRGLLSRKR